MYIKQLNIQFSLLFYYGLDFRYQNVLSSFYLEDVNCLNNLIKKALDLEEQQVNLADVKPFSPCYKSLQFLKQFLKKESLDLNRYLEKNKPTSIDYFFKEMQSSLSDLSSDYFDLLQWSRVLFIFQETLNLLSSLKPVAKEKVTIDLKNLSDQFFNKLSIVLKKDTSFARERIFFENLFSLIYKYESEGIFFQI